MATTQPVGAGDRRRSQRVLIRLPVRLNGTTRKGQPVSARGEAVVISSNGALLKMDSDFRPGSEVEVENSATQQIARYRVVWASDQPTDGRWEVGLESSGSGPNIWGVEFPAD